MESYTFEDSINLMKYGVDVIQLDKIDLNELEKVVIYKNKNFPNIKITVAGGIKLSNVEEYVKKGVDGIVTSSVYNCGMADISSKLKII